MGLMPPNAKKGNTFLLIFSVFSLGRLSSFDAFFQLQRFVQCANTGATALHSSTILSLSLRQSWLNSQWKFELGYAALLPLSLIPDPRPTSLTTSQLGFLFRVKLSFPNRCRSLNIQESSPPPGDAAKQLRNRESGPARNFSILRTFRTPVDYEHLRFSARLRS